MKTVEFSFFFNKIHIKNSKIFLLKQKNVTRRGNRKNEKKNQLTFSL